MNQLQTYARSATWKGPELVFSSLCQRHSCCYTISIIPSLIAPNKTSDLHQYAAMRVEDVFMLIPNWSKANGSPDATYSHLRRKMKLQGIHSDSALQIQLSGTQGEKPIILQYFSYAAY